LPAGCQAVNDENVGNDNNDGNDMKYGNDSNDGKRRQGGKGDDDNNLNRPPVSGLSAAGRAR
jgi:hypothetical protein